MAQIGTLTSRYVKVLSRDYRNLAILFGQVPVIGLAIAFLFKAGVFVEVGSPTGERPGSPDEGIQLLFLLSTTAIWLGSIDASREIVKERSVIAREGAVGVRDGAYLTSKVLVLFVLAALQTVALAFFVFAVRPLDEQAGVYAAVVALLVLTSWVGVAIGLAISAAVSSEDQATSFIPLTLIPQLLFAGAVVPVARMAEPIASLSYLVPSRWALAGIGSAVDMNERLAAGRAGAGRGLRDGLLRRPGGAGGHLLVAFLVAALGLAWLLMGRRSE